MHQYVTRETRGRRVTKLGALACFLLAGALLVTSLFVSPPLQVSTENSALQSRQGR